jgi:hypothetical protein
VYVANSRNVLRPIARDLLPTERDLAIWGTSWEGLIDTSQLVAEHVPNDELHRVYSSAGIVLNDHWDDMREHGYISNRIYDALACGALVLSDDVPGLAERFGDAVALPRGAARADRAAAGRSRRAPPPGGGGPGRRARPAHLRPPDRRAARGGAGARAGAHPCPSSACCRLSGGCRGGAPPQV